MSATLTNPGHVPSASAHEVQLESCADPDVVLLPHDSGSTADLEAIYEEIVLSRVEERHLVVDHAVDAQSVCFATLVAHTSGTPHDVIEVHVATLRRLTADVSSSRAATLLDAGEYILILTLGHLAERYRSLALVSA
ncbi:hypothetical protein GCM10027020_10710 [Nocardioides salsibiostraticola]